jgi:nitrogen fixation protein FixH
MRGRHVLMMFVGFFATIFAVDGFMIYQAVSTFGGIETPDAYRKGVDYNESIAKDKEQARLGWVDDVKIVGAPHRLQVALRDKENGAVAGKKVVATVGRPATDRYDVRLDLAETTPGIYEVALPDAAGGTWLIDLGAYDNASSDQPVYQARRRAWIGP